MFAVVLAALAAAASLAVIPQAAAAADNAAALPPASYTASDCAGQTPVVVGSDAKAQSDIYSAVTLAGVVGTDCVILAGPRDGDMSPDQSARLDAASGRGWVVGGTAAVPEAKIAGRGLARIAGKDRWTTAQRVGTVASSLDGGTAPAPAKLDLSLGLPGDVAEPGVHLHGAGPWIASDCVGDVPIVVGSDAKAQSDIYSAVTLAGVVGTDCVVLAGPRDGEMPASQQTRLGVATAGGFVVGGTAAVPTAKIAGRDMTRLSGADRWGTAQLVGRRASGDTTAGTSTADEPTGSGAAGTTAGDGISAELSCLHSPDFTQWDYTNPADGSHQMKADGDVEVFDPSDPSDDATVVYSGGADCTWSFRNGTGSDVRVRVGGYALYADGSGAAVGRNSQHGLLVAAGESVTAFYDLAWETYFSGDGEPTGSFGVDFPDGDYLRWVADGARVAAECGYWTDTDAADIRELGVLDAVADAVADAIADELSDVEEGSEAYWARYAEVAGRVRQEVYWQYLQPCSGWSATEANYITAPGPPAPSFTVVSAGEHDHACAVRADATVACWGGNDQWGQADAPSGSFSAVSAGQSHSCGLRTNGTVVCWGNNDDGRTDAPSGSFVAVSAGNSHSCGVRTNGSVACWGWNPNGKADPPSGSFTAVSAGGNHSCGLRTDGTVTCWGESDRVTVVAPSGSFVSVSAGGGHACGVRTDDTVACWGVDSGDVPSGSFSAVSAGGNQSCGLRTNGTVTCWGYDRVEQDFAVPSGSYTAVSVSGRNGCALGTNGMVACWWS